MKVNSMNKKQKITNKINYCLNFTILKLKKITKIKKKWSQDFH